MPAIRLLAGAALAAALSLPAGAQPALQSMPMPPSANDPPPKETRAPAKKPPRAAAARRERDGGEAGLAVPAETRARRGAAAETAQRPKRYVPAEFDREGEGGSRVEPFVSQSGRPGMGMRF